MITAKRKEFFLNKQSPKFSEELSKITKEFRIYTIFLSKKKIYFVLDHIHDKEAIRAHAERALHFGATKKELFEVAAISYLVGGVPSYRDTALTLKEVFSDGK